MERQRRIEAFAALGTVLRAYLSADPDTDFSMNSSLRILDDAVDATVRHNPWFILPHVRYALDAIAGILTPENLALWVEGYSPRWPGYENKLNIGVVMAGNIPLVGFHDFLCVLMSGHHFNGKLSSDDDRLLPALVKILTALEPGFETSVSLSAGRLSGFDAIIATGSDNTARYFEYYFGRIPHIIRKNRNGVAFLTGDENENDLEGLSGDIFLYFGRGCRNVAKLFLPRGYSFQNLFASLEKYRYVMDHHKYRNNYDYYKAVFLLNGVSCHDTGFLLLREEPSISSPIAVIYYEYYDIAGQVKERIQADEYLIQCVVTGDLSIAKRIPFGASQRPSLTEYADGVDTMDFLLRLHDR
jgi:hypothetical protein